MQNIAFGALPPQIYKVTPKSYAGPELRYSDIKELKKEGINFIIDLRPLNLRYAKYALKLLKEDLICLFLGIKHKRYSFDLAKKLPDKPFFEKLAEKIDANPKKTYFHCTSGRHRAGFTAAAIKIMHEKIPFNQAIDEMVEKNFWSISGFENEQIKHLKLNNLTNKLAEFKKMFEK